MLSESLRNTFRALALTLYCAYKLGGKLAKYLDVRIQPQADVLVSLDLGRGSGIISETLMASVNRWSFEIIDLQISS